MPVEAEDEIERQGEQARDQNLVDQRRAGGKTKIAREDDEPERDLGASASAARRLKCASIRRVVARSRRGAHRPSPRANRPCGRTISVTTMTA